MVFSTEHYNLSCREYEDCYAVLDQTLYDLCRERPGHGDYLSICAKTNLIGRGYATGIERMIPAKGGQTSSLGQLERLLKDNGVEVDAIFAELKRIEEPLTPEKLRDVVALHGRFTAVLKRLTGKKSPRSFASKHMHFHCPATPIIDSCACWQLARLYRWQTSSNAFELPPGADESYAWHVMRFWRFYSDALAAGAAPTVKKLDYHLLWLAE